MKGTHAERRHTTTPREPPLDFDATYAVVAADTTTASSTMAAALRAAGYVVTTCALRDAVGYVRKHTTSELLVLDGTAKPWLASTLLDALRVDDWTLPIILVAERDPALRAVAERLGVEAVLDAPLQLSDLSCTATRIVPVVKQPWMLQRSSRPPLGHS